MKLARVDRKGKVLEVFEKEGIEEKFNKAFIKILEVIPDDVSVNEYVFKGKKIEAPKNDFWFLNSEGKWEAPEELIKEKQEIEKRNARALKVKEFKEKQNLNNQEIQDAIKLLLSKEVDFIEKVPELPGEGVIK